MADPKRVIHPPYKLPLGANLVDIADRKKLSPKEAARREQVHNSLHVTVGSGAPKGLSIDSEFEGTRVDIPVMEILFYDDNPRTEINPNFAEIKESIRQRLITNPLVVTKKPGSRVYMLSDGGNTRLKAIQELWLETGDKRFEITTCTVRLWKSESHVLIGHLIENEVRGDMCFWDKAKGIAKLKAKLEAEEEAAISNRDMETRLRAMGLPTGRISIGYFFFAVERVSGVGRYLTFQSIKDFQTRLTSSSRLLRKFGTDDTTFWSMTDALIKGYAAGITSGQTQVDEDGKTRHESSFSSSVCLAYCEAAFAKQLDCDLETYTSLREHHDRYSDTTQEGLTSLLRSLGAGAQEPAASSTDTPNTLATVPSTALAPAEKIAPIAGFTQPSASTHPLANLGADLDEGDEPPAMKALATPAPIKPVADRLETKRLALRATCFELARKVGIGTSFKERSVMPYAFYMELQTTSLLEMEGDASAKRTAAITWWWLASLAGQRDDAILTEHVPDHSKYRRTFGPTSDLSAEDKEIQRSHIFGEYPEMVDLQEMLFPNQPNIRLVGQIYLHLADLAELKAEQGVGPVST